MRLNDKKEEFSYAYIHAVVAFSGYSIVNATRPMDNAGIDLLISAVGDGFLKRQPNLFVQVKCTAQSVIGESAIDYSLDRNTHHRLCDGETITPLILVVVCVPTDESIWLAHSEEEMILRKCGYWLSLRGETPTTNSQNVTVNIPRVQRFSPTALREMMQRINEGGMP